MQQARFQTFNPQAEGTAHLCCTSQKVTEHLMCLFVLGACAAIIDLESCPVMWHTAEAAFKGMANSAAVAAAAAASHTAAAATGVRSAICLQAHIP